MLLERADALTRRIADYQKLKAQAHRAQIFQTRADQLQKIASNLTGATDAMKALHSSSIAVAFKMGPKDQTRARTQQLQAGFAQDPAFVEDPGFDLRFEYAVPLAGLADTVKAAALEAWKAHVAERWERVSSDILKALSAVPEYRPIVATVQRCQEQIGRLAASLPADVAAADGLLADTAQEQRDAWQKLTGGELPDGVILFLRASMGDGAELRLLTAEVLDWLKSRGLEGAFRIRPRQGI